MRLVLLTYGTEGDTRPLAALCRSLIDSGHDAMILADGGTLCSAREIGVPHASLAGDIRGAMQSISLSAHGKVAVNATAKAMAALANEHADAWMQQVLDTTAGSDGLVAGGLAAYVGFSAAEKLSVPVIGAGMIPLTATKEFPSPFLASMPVPRWLNRMSYGLVAAMLWSAFRKGVNAARAKAGLAAGQKIWLGHTMLYGISPTLLPRPADWPDNAWMCGQWVHPVQEWKVPETLEHFLAAGDKPIYVGFGSMVGFDRDALLGKLVAAVNGQRVLFYPGWSGASSLELPRNFFAIGETPHEWLFPRTSLVIHHGGSGTTHSAARAGVPSVVLPIAADQFFWAKQVSIRGIGAAVTAGTDVKAADLSRAIETAQGERIRNRAREIGAKMRTEDGLSEAVKRVEQLLSGTWKHGEK